jgi:hypothetical protein
MPYWIENARLKASSASISIWERVQRPYGKARFKVRMDLGLIPERHDVTVIGLWRNDDGWCYGNPDTNGIPDLRLVYLVECGWCAKKIGESPDPAEAIRIAYEHSPYVDRGTFHRSRLYAANAVLERDRVRVRPRGRFTEFGEIVVNAPPPETMRRHA